MLRKLLPLCCVVGTALCISACQREAPREATATSAAPQAAASGPSTKKAPTDLEQLAERLVTQSAGVIEGERILILGGAQDQELLENIAVHVRKVGAFPLVQLNSDRMAKRLFFDVPEKFDTQTDALGLKVAETFNAVIAVNSNLDEALFADADPKRQAARAKAGQPITDAFMKRKVRFVEVGNGLYPTDWLAKRFGMTHDELTRAFWDGVNIDYSSLAGHAEQVKAAVTGASEVHITHPNGTDLKVRVQGRPVYASDGIISRAEAQKGGAAANVYLPAGEVYVTPVAGTAEGKVLREREYFQGKEIQNLALTFVRGKLTSITGSGPGFQPLKALYDAAGEGKDIFAAVDFGINPNIKLPANSPVGTWVPAGTVTVGVGNNIWAGGDNKAAYGYFVSLPGTTVTLDAKPVIENGQLKI